MAMKNEEYLAHLRKTVKWIHKNPQFWEWLSGEDVSFDIPAYAKALAIRELKELGLYDIIIVVLTSKVTSWDIYHSISEVMWENLMNSWNFEELDRTIDRIADSLERKHN